MAKKKFEFDENFNISLEIKSFYNTIQIELGKESSDLHRVLKADKDGDEKKISVYQISIDFLYLNAFIFIYLILKLESCEYAKHYENDLNELIKAFNKIESPLKEESLFSFLKTEEFEEKKKKVENDVAKFLWERKAKTEKYPEDKANLEEKKLNEAFVKVMYQRYSLDAEGDTLETKMYIKGLLYEIYHYKLAHLCNLTQMK